MPEYKHEFHPVNVTELYEWIKREFNSRDEKLKEAGFGGPVSDSDARVDAEGDQLEKAANALKHAEEQREKNKEPALPGDDVPAKKSARKSDK